MRFVQTSSRRSSPGSPALPVNPVGFKTHLGAAGEDAASAQRELVVRGPADQRPRPRSFAFVDTRSVRRDRSIEAGFGPPEIVRCRAIHPMSERPCDRRCSSGSSLGKALSDVRVQHSARGALGRERERGHAGLSGGPLVRETSAGVAWKPGLGREARAGMESRGHPAVQAGSRAGLSRRSASGQGLNPVRRSPPGPAQAGCAPAAASAGARKVRGGARRLF